MDTVMEELGNALLGLLAGGSIIVIFAGVYMAVTGF